MVVYLIAMSTDFEDEEYRVQGDIHCHVCSIRKENFFKPVPLKIKRIWLGCDTCGIALCFDLVVPRNAGKPRFVDVYQRP